MTSDALERPRLSPWFERIAERARGIPSRYESSGAVSQFRAKGPAIRARRLLVLRTIIETRNNHRSSLTLGRVCVYLAEDPWVRTGCGAAFCSDTREAERQHEVGRLRRALRQLQRVQRQRHLAELPCQP